jgi:hypothetical protein
MAAKQSNALRRLQDAVLARKRTLALSEEMMERVGFMKLLQDSQSIDSNDPLKEFWQLPLKMYFKLDRRSQQDQRLLEAFEVCELDPAQLSHWRVLLDAFVESTFHDPGAKQKWTETAYANLLEDIEAVKMVGPARSNDTEIAKQLKKRFAKKYQRQEIGRLRKLVGQAQDPATNPAAQFSKEDRKRNQVLHMFGSIHPEVARMLAGIVLKPGFRNQVLALLRNSDPDRFADMSEGRIGEFYDAIMEQALNQFLAESTPA